MTIRLIGKRKHQREKVSDSTATHQGGVTSRGETVDSGCLSDALSETYGFLLSEMSQTM